MTEVLPSSPEAIRRAVELLAAGRLVAFPTETVYGLGADATRDDAVAAIFAAKQRPRFNPLIAHVHDREAAAREAAFDARSERLAARFWPGPLTLVLPRRRSSSLSLLCSAGLDTVALRVPAQPTARTLLSLFGRPVAAPSANRSGRVSPTRAEHVLAELAGRVDLILDDGPCRVGLESTVVSLTGKQAVLLRPGGLCSEAIEAVLGEGLARPSHGGVPVAPGMLESHYAPQLPLRLDADGVSHDEALLAFGPDVPGGAARTLNLSPSGNLQEAAANLFAFLRRLDRPELEAIAVMSIPETGLGVAINDRLRRAAAPRPSSH